MAVVNKHKGRAPKPYELLLEDGQTVNAMAIRGGQTVGGEREFQQVQREIAVINQRVEFLTQEAVKAPDDKTYESKLRYVKKFEKSYADLEPQVDKILLVVLTDWDLALTEEDEREGITVPITPEGLKTVNREMKYDIFSKLMDKFLEDAEEKKDALPTSQNGSAVKVNSEPSHTGTSITN